MNLEEAIKHAEDISKENNTCEECKIQHKQLSEWLKELKNSRNEKEKFKNYLDKAIIQWRKDRDKSKNEEDKLMAMCYIDAFQSVRIFNFW